MSSNVISGPFSPALGQDTARAGLDQLSVFISHCRKAITTASKVDPYHIDVISSLRAAIEIRGLKRVKGYIDRHVRDESVRFVLKDTAGFIEQNKVMSDFEISRRLNEIQDALAREVQALYDSVPTPCHWPDSDWNSFVQKVTGK